MSPRLLYILGGAAFGAILGAVYANYLYTAGKHKGPFWNAITNDSPTVEEPEWEPERAESARVQRAARKTEETPASE